MHVNWKAVWLTVWFAFLIADQIFGLRGHFVGWVTESEQAAPELFHRRIESALLAAFVVAAIAPLVWTLLRRWFFTQPSQDEAVLVRDPRDITVAEAVMHVARDSAWSRRFDEGDSDEDRLAAAARSLEEAARKGRLIVRGRRGSGQKYVEPIDRAYWAHAGLDLDATLDPGGTGGKTRHTGDFAGPKPPVYDNLIVDRETVERLWPRDNVWRKTGRATARGMAWSVGMRRRKREKSGAGD